MAHIHDLYDFTSSGYIVHQNTILLIHHKKLKVWIPPGGHVELNEDPLDALWREIYEETGLNNSQLDLAEKKTTVESNQKSNNFKSLPTPFAMFVVDYDNESNHKHIDLCYLMSSNTDKVKLEKSSSYDIGWFSETQLDKLYKNNQIFENSSDYCKYALKYFAK